MSSCLMESFVFLRTKKYVKCMCNQLKSSTNFFARFVLPHVDSLEVIQQTSNDKKSQKIDLKYEKGKWKVRREEENKKIEKFISKRHVFYCEKIHKISSRLRLKQHKNRQGRGGGSRSSSPPNIAIIEHCLWFSHFSWPFLPFDFRRLILNDIFLPSVKEILTLWPYQFRYVICTAILCGNWAGRGRLSDISNSFLLKKGKIRAKYSQFLVDLTEFYFRTQDEHVEENAT